MVDEGPSQPYNSMIRELVRRHATLNRIRKFVRFVQSVPPTELLSSRTRAAFRVRSKTLLDYGRLAAIHEVASAAPPGAFVECGVWAGGSAGMMSLAALVAAHMQRQAQQDQTDVVFPSQAVHFRHIGPDIDALQRRKPLGSQAKRVAQGQSDALFP